MKDIVEKMRGLKEHSYDTVNDPVFGRISYHKQGFINNTDFQKSEYICDMPFYYLEIDSVGNARVCCASWNPAIIGNVLKEDIVDIWHGEKINIIRNSIIDGSYKYCNHAVCPRLRQNKELIEKKDFLNPLRLIPLRISFLVDFSCNLVCPSCRNSKINNIDNDDFNKTFSILNTVTSSLFKEPHNDPISIGFDGAGEVFQSYAYRKFFETNRIFLEPECWPNLDFNIQTNGTMLTEKIQKKYSKWLKKVSLFSISVDAGDKESYEKVRVGGDWDLFWENIDCLYNNTIKNTDMYWNLNVIVQDQNFRSIPKLIDIVSNRYKENLPRIKLSRILNWGSFTTEQFLKKAVWMPEHPDYQELQEIFNLQEFKRYKRMKNFC